MQNHFNKSISFEKTPLFEKEISLQLTTNYWSYLVDPYLFEEDSHPVTWKTFCSFSLYEQQNELHWYSKWHNTET